MESRPLEEGQESGYTRAMGDILWLLHSYLYRREYSAYPL